MLLEIIDPDDQYLHRMLLECVCLCVCVKRVLFLMDVLSHCAAEISSVYKTATEAKFHYYVFVPTFVGILLSSYVCATI